jgi:exosortase
VHPALNPESSGLRTLLRCLSSPGGFATCNSNVAVPIPKILWNPIVLGLQNFITMLNVETLKLIGIPAIQQANIIKLPNCLVGVDEACSGVRSLQSSIMAGLFIGYLVLKGPGIRMFLVLAAIAAAILGNFLRSFYLSLTAHYSGPQAIENAHDAAGWSVLLFTAVAVGLFAWLAARLEQQAESAQSATHPQNPEPITTTNA